MSTGTHQPEGPEEEIQLPADQFWEEYKGQILTAVGVLVVLGIAVVGWFAWAHAQRDAAETLFSTATSPGQWQQVIERHSGTPAADGARLLLAASLRASGDAAAADAIYAEMLGRQSKYPLISAAALGQAEIAAGTQPDSPALADKFQQAAIRFPRDYTAAFALYSGGDILLRAGQDLDAMRIFRNLATDYPMSPLARMASMQVQRIASALPADVAARELGGPPAITPDGMPAAAPTAAEP